MNLAAVISSIKADEAAAEAIAAKVVYYVQVAETSVANGATKLAGVKAAMQAYITDYYPQFVTEFETLWTELSAFVSGLVALYNAIGVFAKVVKP